MNEWMYSILMAGQSYLLLWGMTTLIPTHRPIRISAHALKQNPKCSGAIILRKYLFCRIRFTHFPKQTDEGYGQVSIQVPQMICHCFLCPLGCHLCNCWLRRWKCSMCGNVTKLMLSFLLGESQIHQEELSQKVNFIFIKKKIRGNDFQSHDSSSKGE